MHDLLFTFFKKIYFINLLSPFWDVRLYECGPKTNRIISVILQFFLWRLEIANLFDDFISSNLVYIILKDLNVIVLVTLDKKDQND